LTLTLAEGCVDTLSTYINANIVAKLAALDAEYTDTIVLAAPVATYISDKSIRSIPTYPALLVLSDEQDFRPMSDSGGKDKPTVYVGILEIDTDPEVLQRRVFRYRRAIIELLLAANALNGWVISTDDDWASGTGIDPTDSSASDFLGGAIVRIRASAWEE
jgi:hypothetical protein